jgi:prepilin-type N-terminal cleavage/methylation domain-containing protein
MIGAMQNRKGFTLVELLVAAALFATVIAVAVNLFILALRRPLIEVDNQHLQEEVTYMFEVLANRLTTSTIAYGNTAITNPTSELYLTDPRGSAVYRYYLSGSQILVEEVSTGISTPMTTTANNDVAIDSLRFYVYPQSSPADPSAAVNNQPAVVVAVSGHSVKDTARTFKIQTLLTSRIYVR